MREAWKPQRRKSRQHKEPAKQWNRFEQAAKLVHFPGMGALLNHAYQQEQGPRDQAVAEHLQHGSIQRDGTHRRVQSQCGNGDADNDVAHVVD